MGQPRQGPRSFSRPLQKPYFYQRDSHACKLYFRIGIFQSAIGKLWVGLSHSACGVARTLTLTRTRTLIVRVSLFGASGGHYF